MDSKQAMKVIKSFHKLLINSNDNSAASEAKHLEVFLKCNEKELNDSDIKENR